MKILNLFAGLGGNRERWVGHDITAVEISPSIAKAYTERFPQDKIVVCDAFEFLMLHHSEFDFIWLSPPCQSHSKTMFMRGKSNYISPDNTLLELVIYCRSFVKCHWIVENVRPYYKPCISPVSRFGRHMFWSGVMLPSPQLSKVVSMWDDSFTHVADKLKQVSGVSYTGNVYQLGSKNPCQAIRNMCSPVIGKFYLDFICNLLSVNVN